MPISVAPNLKGAEPRYDKSVTSWKARKFMNIVPQQTDFSCGAAALATIFNHAYGYDASEAHVLVNMMKVADPEIVEEKGFSLLDMKNYVAAIGMAGEGFEVEFDMLRELRVPGVVLVDIKGYRHFVVLRKVEGDHVFIADPALGNRHLHRDSFEEMWNGVVFVVLADGLDPANALQNPPPPLSARRLFDQRSPVQNALPADFGPRLVGSVSF